MSTGMGVANPKFSQSGRKSKKTKHCTIPKSLICKREAKRVPIKGTGLISLKVAIKETTI